MTAVAILALQALGCLGLGAALLRMLRIDARGAGEQAALAFAVGFGGLGWLVFFLGAAGLIGRPALAVLLVAGLPGLALLRRTRFPEALKWRMVDVLLVAGLSVAMAFDLAEALVPPADADTLAYHFTIPKMMVAEGALVFVPRAVDGAVPLLAQMTYVPALALGGERALTLWTMLSGWAMVGLFYAVARTHLARTPALVATLVLATTPAVVYGAGAGQVEVRNALFVITAAVGVAMALKTGLVRWAVLAGLACGFFAATKYLGLLFAFACGVTILAQRRWLGHAVALSLAFAVAGFQWYLWNWLNAGDPVFPLLALVLDSPIWDAAHAEAMARDFFAAEKAVPADPLWFFGYPFLATLAGPPQFESGRTGLGPFVLLLLPLAAAGLWTGRRRLKDSPLLPIAVIVLLFYALWFFTGSSQRVRHLLPVYPLLLLLVGVAAARFAAMVAWRWGWGPFAAAALFTVAVQMGVHGLFSLGALRHLAEGAGRDAYLARNVPVYGAVNWINANLGPGSRLLVRDRQLLYSLEVPAYLAHTVQEALIDIREETTDWRRFAGQLGDLGITHMLLAPDPRQAEARPGGIYPMTRALMDRGCARVVKDFELATFASRTLAEATGRRLSAAVVAFDPVACQPLQSGPTRGNPGQTNGTGDP